MKKIIAVILALAMVASLAGCTQSQASQAEASASAGESAAGEASQEATGDTGKSLTDVKIGAMPADASVGFFQAVAEGMQAAGDAFGCKIDLQYTGRDLNKEQSLTDTYISQGFDGLVMNASDSAAITGCLTKAKEAGVPMVSVDTTPERTDLAAGTVTSDNYKGGHAAGELMKELLPDGGDIIMTKLKFASVAMDERYQGFQDAIEGSPINIIDTIEQDGTREDTLAKLSPLLTKYDSLVGIYCTQGDPAIGALSAVDTAGMADKITIVSYDVEDEVAEAIKNDTAIKGGVTQFPYAIGYFGVYECLRSIQGLETEEVLKLPVLPVTKDNVEEFSADSIAFLQKYGEITLPTTFD
ncbi:sugar ABC transporter substrate-binding protein [Christensenella intestinihominis]|uniref:sugar ABC transporter substrate-binding protein n=1 Tax=Christensenella intestinihominis TaxID=1851429 RepID=UPI000831291E|nr:sugar ABC transporter substrate-binding protein [Christensenella intestinihominis]